MTFRTLRTAILLLLLAPLALLAQGVFHREQIPITPADSLLPLPHSLLVSGTLRVRLDSIPLAEGLDYRFDPVAGGLLLEPTFRGRLRLDSLHDHLLTVEYRYHPISLEQSYARRRLVTVIDSTGGRVVVAQSEGLSGSSIFGRDFERSGSIVRGFTVGTNRDVTLQSGLRLQFSGNITDDVEVIGALTDEQTPIQPEGTTQTLREVDNLFIEVRSPWVGGTIGKFIASDRSNSYTAFSRKVQGVRAQARYAGGGTTEVVAAVAPGKFRTQEIQGRERDQGPYRLLGEGGERGIIVVAGTERVWVDGLEMVRGESNDYVIDYAAAEVTFQTRRPISSLSRIVVEFEYSDQQYSRSFIAATQRLPFADSTLRLAASVVRLADDPDATIDISLDEADRRLLAAAGADRSLAARSGARYVGRGDTLKGSYVRIDTTIDGRPDSLYRYLPASPEAVWSVVFSVPAEGRGDYRYVAFGEYEYVGRGLGTYLPVVYLPLPELRQVAGLTLEWQPAATAGVRGEIAFSDTRLNRLSDLPEASRRGLAFNLAGSFSEPEARVAGASIGALRFAASARYLDAGFRTIERVGDVDFLNRWNAAARPGESSFDDLLAEGLLSWSPLRGLRLDLSQGLLRRGELFRSHRQEYAALFLDDSIPFAADAAFELVATDSLSGARVGRWERERAGVSYRLGGFIPGFRVERQVRDDRDAPDFIDTLLPTSFRTLELAPDLTIELPFMRTQLLARYRIDDSVRSDPANGAQAYLRDGVTRSLTVRGELRGLRTLSSTLDLTWRRRSYDEVAGVDPSGRLDNATLLARSQTRWNGFDRGLELEALYDVQTEQAARLQRLFVRVPFGQGDYVWIDYDENGVATDEEFRLTNAGDGEYVVVTLPTEELFPVIDLRTSARLRLVPERVFGADGGSWLERALIPFTSETVLRLDEKSQSPREVDVYLLRPSALLNDSTTLSGSALLQQDLHLFERGDEFSSRLRYLARNGLTRLVRTIERSSTYERSLRLRWKPTIDIGLQVDLASRSSSLTSTDSLSRRPFDLRGLDGSGELSYRPMRDLELGWIVHLATNDDRLPALPRSVDIAGNTIRAIYALESRGRAQLEIERTVVDGTNIGEDALALPYELTGGYAIGTTWIARARLDYRFGGNIQASLVYTGRAQPPTMRLFHIATAELRAYF